jgi:hypothetical protein
MVMKQILVIFAACLPLVAHADKLRLPADTPSTYQKECAACHVAFPPSLMMADDWKKVLASLDNHYDDEVILDEKTRRSLEDFLLKNAGGTKVGSGGTAQGSPLPRLTGTLWFTRKHREVPKADWRNPKVNTPSNCTACHKQAEQGSYSEREIVMPDGRRWED